MVKTFTNSAFLWKFPWTRIEPGWSSGVSISRGPTPLSSPGGRNSRSPSLSMPPASPVAKTNRVRSASLAVTSHKTPPLSPGSRPEIFSVLFCFHWCFAYWKRKMEHYNLHLSFETLRLISQGQDCQVVCPWHPVCLPTGHSRLTPTSTSPPTPRPTSPGWAPSLSLPARPRPWARSSIFRWEQRNISSQAQPRPSFRTLILVVMISTKLCC